MAQGPQNDDALNLEENARIFFGFKTADSSAPVGMTTSILFFRLIPLLCSIQRMLRLSHPNWIEDFGNF